MERVILYDVIDIRTGKHHAVARVRQRDVKWFVKAEIGDDAV